VSEGVGDDVGDATGQLSAVVGPDLLRIAEEAEGRSLYRHAVRLYQRAAEAGDSDALLRAAELLEGAGRIDEAIGLDQRAAEAGNPSPCCRRPGCWRMPAASTRRRGFVSTGLNPAVT
jgi:hypothetical protein